MTEDELAERMKEIRLKNEKIRERQKVSSRLFGEILCIDLDFSMLKQTKKPSTVPWQLNERNARPRKLSRIESKPESIKLEKQTRRKRWKECRIANGMRKRKAVVLTPAKGSGIKEREKVELNSGTNHRKNPSEEKGNPQSRRIQARLVLLLGYPTGTRPQMQMQVSLVDLRLAH